MSITSPIQTDPAIRTSAPSRAATLFVVLTVTLDTTAMGMLSPVLPDLVRNVSGASVADLSGMLGILLTLFALMQFVASPVQGAISDRFGRRPVILVSNLGLALAYLMLSVAPNVLLIMISWAFAGIISGSAAAATAYLTDITSESRRASVFGLLGAGGALGAVLGPAIGGGLAWLSPQAPFLAAAALSFANAAAVFVFVRESLPPDKRAAFSPTMFNPFAGVRTLVKSFPDIPLWIVASFAASLAMTGLATLMVVYLREVLHWSVQSIGILLTVFGATRILTQAILVGPALSAFGERSTLLLGFSFQILGMVLFGATNHPAAIWTSAVLLGVGSLFVPVFGAAVSRGVGPSDQGRLQGVFRSIGAAASIVGPVPFAAIFALGVQQTGMSMLTGIPFFAGAFLMLVSMVIAIFGLGRLRSPTSEPGQAAQPATTDASSIDPERAA